MMDRHKCRELASGRTLARARWRFLIIALLAMVVAAVLTGCGGKGGVQQKQHEYEVVQEGSASGVTSTIQGPGETVPPVTATGSGLSR